MKINRLALLFSTLLILLFLYCRAALAQATVNAPRFSGSELSLEKAVAQSDAAVIATLVKLGVLQPTAPGQAAYERTTFKVKRVLKDNIGY